MTQDEERQAYVDREARLDQEGLRVTAVDLALKMAGTMGKNYPSCDEVLGYADMIEGFITGKRNNEK